MSGGSCVRDDPYLRGRCDLEFMLCAESYMSQSGYGICLNLGTVFTMIGV